MIPHQDDQLPIIDAHHHFWDLERNYHPWLRDEPMIPFRYGDYSTIRCNFMPADYAALTGHHNVVANVTMEGEWDERDPVAESAWLSEVAAEQGTPAAHVARAFLHQSDAPDILRAHAEYSIVRGIRHKPTAAPTPDTVERGVPGSLSDPAWQAGYAELQPNGLHFELQAPWWHVDELLALIDRFPETPVIINHCFMPVDRTREGRAAWAAALKRAADAPNVSLKISGIGIAGKRWQIEDQRPIIETCIDTFSPARCLFASNFPVDGICGSLETIFDGFILATNDLTRTERLALFHNNAVRIYRLGIKPIPA